MPPDTKVPTMTHWTLFVNDKIASNKIVHAIDRPSIEVFCSSFHDYTMLGKLVIEVCEISITKL